MIIGYLTTQPCSNQCGTCGSPSTAGLCQHLLPAVAQQCPHVPCLLQSGGQSPPTMCTVVCSVCVHVHFTCREQKVQQVKVGIRQSGLHLIWGGGNQFHSWITKTLLEKVISDGLNFPGASPQTPCILSV